MASRVGGQSSAGCRAMSGWSRALGLGYEQARRLQASSLSAAHHCPRRLAVYVRFPLCLRLVEELSAERGITVSYETVRCRAKKSGPH